MPSIITRTITLTVAAAALALAACSSDGDPDPTATPPEPTATVAPSPVPQPTEAPPAVLDWRQCGSGFECADIQLPLAYDDAVPGTITLPLIRRPAEGADRIGSLLVNPGGPGVSGVQFLRSASLLFSPEVRQRFDLVAWDPRGVAGSEPAVDCLDDLDDYISGDPSPDTVEEQQALNETARLLAEGCDERSGDLLPYLSSDYTARDMDRIRAALGDDKLTYFGYSYGTVLGAVYAELFPTRIRAMVLDAAADPSISAAQDTKNQVLGFERSFNEFLADCGADASCAYYSAGNPGAAYDALIDRIDAEPLPGDSSLDVGPGIAVLGVVSSLYSSSQWDTLADSLALAESGDGSALLDLSSFVTGRIGPGSFTDELEQRIAIICVDFERMSYDEKVAMQAELAVEAPRFGDPGIGPAGDPCDFWPVPSNLSPRRITAPGSPPIVVIGTTGDPATPYQQAVSLADQLSRGVLLTLQAERHTAYGGVSACIDDAVDRYLIDLDPPPADTICQ